MAANDIQTIGVLGAGTMGNGIAHVFARAGYRVILRDIEKRFLDRGLQTIAKNLDREVKKNTISEADKSAALSRIEPATELQALGAADFVVEAVPERRLDLQRFESKGRGTAALRPRRDSREQHFLDFDHAARRAN